MRGKQSKSLPLTRPYTYAGQVDLNSERALWEPFVLSIAQNVKMELAD